MMVDIELLLEGLDGSISDIVDCLGELPANAKTQQTIQNIKKAVANAQLAFDNIYCMCERLPDFEEIEKQNELLLELLASNLTYEQKLNIRINFGIDI